MVSQHSLPEHFYFLRTLYIVYQHSLTEHFYILILTLYIVYQLLEDLYLQNTYTVYGLSTLTPSASLHLLNSYVWYITTLAPKLFTSYLSTLRPRTSLILTYAVYVISTLTPIASLHLNTQTLLWYMSNLFTSYTVLVYQYCLLNHFTFHSMLYINTHSKCISTS